MKYVSEAGPITCLSKWKPCTAEVFSQMLHSYHTKFCDENGHEAFMNTSYKLDKAGGTVTVFYARIKARSIGTPVLLTMSQLPSNKVLCFETTEDLPERTNSI